jgi:hypothetical protein
MRPGWDPNVKTATLGEARTAEHPVPARQDQIASEHLAAPNELGGYTRG